MKAYQLEALYEIQLNHPRTARREGVAIAFGLVNAWYIRQQLEQENRARPVYIKRVDTKGMLLQRMRLT